MHLKMGDGPMDRPMDGPTDGPMDGPTDGPMDGPTDGQSLLHIELHFAKGLTSRGNIAVKLHLVFKQVQSK